MMFIDDALLVVSNPEPSLADPAGAIQTVVSDYVRSMYSAIFDEKETMKVKTNAIRVFHITTNPCVADPAWLIKCWEDVDATHVNQFYDYEEIKSLISDCETKQIKAVGRAEEFERILKMFGASGYKELIEMAERCKAQKEAA